MDAGISIRAYARHRGVSHTAVRKALASGRIALGAHGKIDAALADKQWAAATDLSKPRNSVNGVPRKRRAIDAVSDPIGSTGWDSAAGSASEAATPRLVSSYAASRAAREAYLARLAKLEFEQKSAKLVDADEVRAQIFALGRRIRDTLLGIPDRLAPVLAGQADPAEIHRTLSAELVASLAELSVASPIQVVGRPELRP